MEVSLLDSRRSEVIWFHLELYRYGLETMSTPLGLNSNVIYPLHEANREYAQSQVPRSVADGGVNSHKLTTDDALSYLKDVSRSRGQVVVSSIEEYKTAKKNKKKSNLFPLVAVNLIEEDLQKLALEANAIKNIVDILKTGFLSLEVLDLLVNALTHNNADVRTAACICFRNAHVMLPLVQLLHDPSSSVQVAVLGALSIA
ncbi:hypothetical protein DY000_02045288 [Brassica cretica]|uniref:Armadillo repeat-containing domain-containing protein n=1 Tax=Brassica cretica TaxID=69181 RepID=A0ABQ7EWY2_BRACR|nr:hypothetical protein DY000_02045288 [Brassica cretica]